MPSPGLNDTPPPGHDEVGQSMLGVDIDRFRIRRGMAKGLHCQVSREAEAGEVLKFIPCHGPRRVLGTHGGHARLAVSARADTLNPAGPAHHFLSQREAFV